MERCIMELVSRVTSQATGITKRSNQCGISLIELMIAMAILTIGVLGCMSLIITAIATNGRNRYQSSSTTAAQMITEKIMSVPANTSPTLSFTDCSGTAQNLNTTGSTTGAGAGLLSSGDVDYSQTAVTGYSMLYTTCGQTGQQAVYDVRWNIKTLSNYSKLITVSAKLQGTATDPKLIAFPVTIRSLAGQGS
jgi:prepilin-type N-terminal cleavage/methylation domain-containing protein